MESAPQECEIVGGALCAASWGHDMRHAILAGAAALAFCIVSGAADAGPIPPGGLTLREIVHWLHDAGYKAEIQPSSEGRPNIRSAAEGTEFHIYQYDCKQDVCGSLQFSVGFDTKGAFKSHDMNEWNRKNRWVRAFTDDVHDPWLAQDVDLTPGASYENLNDEFEIWRSSLKRFRDEVHP